MNPPCNRDPSSLLQPSGEGGGDGVRRHLRNHPHSYPPPPLLPTRRLSSSSSFLPALLFRWLALSTVAFLFGAYRAVSDASATLTKLLETSGAAVGPSSTAAAAGGSASSLSSSSSSFSLAYRDSYGFFADTPSWEWEILRNIAASSGRAEVRRLDGRSGAGSGTIVDDDGYWANIPPRAFYARNFHPNFSCRFEVRMGGAGDGPTFVCDPHRIPDAADFDDGESEPERRTTVGGLHLSSSSENEEESGRRKRKRCLVYSFGSGANFRFEFALQALLGPERRCEIHVFDVDGRAAAIVPKLMDIHFHEWGLKRDNGPRRPPWDEVTPDENYAYPSPPSINNVGDGSTNGIGGGVERGGGGAAARPQRTYRSLPQTMQLLGHSGRTLDVLRVDCEGCEWTSYRDWIRGASLDGIAVPMLPPPRQILVELHESPPPHARGFFDAMRREGYVVFHREPNLERCSGRCATYGFLRLRPEFYDER